SKALRFLFSGVRNPQKDTKRTSSTKTLSAWSFSTEMFPGLLILVTFFLNFNLAEAQMSDGRLCYILDGLLVMYSIILTILYCRLRIKPTYKTPGKYPDDTSKYPDDTSKYPDDTSGYQKGERLYAGLTHQGQDTYETIKVQKKAMLV
ncbi:hypothetical protein DPEC_G00067080, partial [Dallia pectoralis]